MRPTALIVLATATLAAAAPAADQRTLETVFSSDLVVNGATESADGRLFLPVQPGSPGAGPAVVEVRNGRPLPFPDTRWNGWQPGMDGADRFVGVNAFRIGRRALGRRRRRGPAWSILRPDVIPGDAPGNAMNIATVIGAYPDGLVRR